MRPGRAGPRGRPRPRRARARPRRARRAPPGTGGLRRHPGAVAQQRPQRHLAVRRPRHHRRTGSSSDSSPAAARRRIATAVTVLVIDPIRYAVCSASPGTAPYPSLQQTSRRAPGRRRATAAGRRPAAGPGRSAAGVPWTAATGSAAGRLTRRTPRAAGRRRPGCGRSRPGRAGHGGQYLSGVRCPPGTRRWCGRRPAPSRRPAPATCAGRGAAGSPRRSTPPPRRGRSRRGWRPRVAEPIDLGEVLGLRGLDHEGARDRERHGRRVEAVVDQALGDVLDAHAVALVIPRRSRMHSWVTSPSSPAYSTGKDSRSRAAT